MLCAKTFFLFLSAIYLASGCTSKDRRGDVPSGTPCEVTVVNDSGGAILAWPYFGEKELVPAGYLGEYSAKSLFPVKDLSKLNIFWQNEGNEQFYKASFPRIVLDHQSGNQPLRMKLTFLENKVWELSERDKGEKNPPTIFLSGKAVRSDPPD